METEIPNSVGKTKTFRFYHFIGAEYVEDFFRSDLLKVTQLGHSNDYFEFKPGFGNHQVESAWNLCVKGAEPCVVCLSTRMSSPVMWGHYGKSGKGACLVFDIPLSKRSNFRKSVFAPEKEIYAYLIEAIQQPIAKVSYINSRLIINRMLPHDSDEMNTLVTELACSKAKDWEYEKEYRIIVKDRCLSAKNGNLFFSGMMQFCSAVLLGWDSPISRAYLSAVLREENRKDVCVVDVYPSLTKCEISSCCCNGELYQDTSVEDLDAWGI
ncbi:MAG: DUF2971 domain-containing protein [Bacteroidaceae bacterium]|nr:DUF2971 domain-containing protein [Bacteroidaceae bacterium]